MAEDYYNSSLTGDEIESRLLGAVVYNATQVIPEDRRVQARRNIGAMKDRDVDSLPRGGSTNLITSGGVYDAMGGVFSPTKLATPGAVVHFEDGAYKRPLEALRVAINPVQSGTGDPSPDNVRPITGWTGAVVKRVGKNFAKLSSSNEGSHQNSTPTYSSTGVTLTATGTNGRMGWIFPVKKGATYKLSFKASRLTGSGLTNKIYLGSDDGVWTTSSPQYYNVFDIPVTPVSYSFSFTAETSIVFFGLYVSSTGSSGSITVADLQLCLASNTDPVFAPYAGSATYPISFGSAGTVYGGTLDVVSGELTVDRAKLAITSSMNIDTLTNATSGNGIYITSALPTAMNRSSGICTHAVVGEYLSDINNMMLGNGNRYIYWTSIMDLLGISTVAEFKSWLDTQTVEVVFELATPQTYTLTAPEVLTLLGENNIWADTGDIEELAYRADIGLYLVDALNPIKELIANRENSMKATRNYTTGDYIIAGNTFYKVLTSIANGTSLTINGNVRITTVGAEIKTALQN